jgi:hypothetical protein
MTELVSMIKDLRYDLTIQVKRVHWRSFLSDLRKLKTFLIFELSVLVWI